SPSASAPVSCGSTTASTSSTPPSAASRRAASAARAGALAWKSTRRCSRSCGRREERSEMAIDEGKLREFVGKAMGDMGAAMGAALVVIGDKLGLYKAMAGAGPLASAELAKRTGCAERYVREWLAAQAAGGYVTYDAAAKIESGARVADVGCGHGASTILLAEAYPGSTYVGFDYHEPSISWARKAASRAGVADRVRFEVASSKAYPGKGYDLVAFFDCLH